MKSLSSLAASWCHAGLASLWFFSVAGAVSAQPRDQGPSPPRSLSGGFVENQGQWPATVAFLGGAGPCRVDAGPAGLALSAHGVDAAGRPARASVRMAVENAERTTPKGEGLLPGLRHFLLGNDPARWRRNVGSFQSVV